jgi:hypothetical protein
MVRGQWGYAGGGRSPTGEHLRGNVVWRAAYRGLALVVRFQPVAAQVEIESKV